METLCPRHHLLGEHNPVLYQQIRKGQTIKTLSKGNYLIFVFRTVTVMLWSPVKIIQWFIRQAKKPSPHIPTMILGLVIPEKLRFGQRPPTISFLPSTEWMNPATILQHHGQKMVMSVCVSNSLNVEMMGWPDSTVCHRNPCIAAHQGKDVLQPIASGSMSDSNSTPE